MAQANPHEVSHRVKGNPSTNLLAMRYTLRFFLVFFGFYVFTAGLMEAVTMIEGYTVVTYVVLLLVLLSPICGSWILHHTTRDGRAYWITNFIVPVVLGTGGLLVLQTIAGLPVITLATSMLLHYVLPVSDNGSTKKTQVNQAEIGGGLNAFLLAIATNYLLKTTATPWLLVFSIGLIACGITWFVTWNMGRGSLDKAGIVNRKEGALKLGDLQETSNFMKGKRFACILATLSSISIMSFPFMVITALSMFSNHGSALNETFIAIITVAVLSGGALSAWFLHCLIGMGKVETNKKALVPSIAACLASITFLGLLFTGQNTVIPVISIIFRVASGFLLPFPVLSLFSRKILVGKKWLGLKDASSIIGTILGVVLVFMVDGNEIIIVRSFSLVGLILTIGIILFSISWAKSMDSNGRGS
ncbi:hypothetical protein GF325_02195 [Candidatus Bathyarchaeota archaeon]|nr:hypothetical protein [Candidatus Bathyarchaeota archaeon]